MGSELVLRDFSLAMDVVHNGRLLGRLEVPVPGRHNALNALAVTAVCLELGLRFEQIQSGFQIASLPRRRFETVSERHGIRVISDYAHHPSEIAALIRTARSVKSHRFIGVYQPHRFTRTLALGRDFPPSFDGLDELVLCPVYAASEKPLKGGTTWDLYRHVREQRPALNVKAATSLENAWGYLRTQLRAGDLFLVIGAGDVESIAAWAKDDRVPRPGPPVCGPGTRFSTDEPLAGKTGYRVGGAADSWADVGDRNDLAALIQWARKNGLPWHVLGAGRNVLVSDLGVRGLVMRLSGPAFRQIERTPDGVRAGAGVTLNTLLDWMQEQGFAGYEFLEGIPGTVGGAVRMNAGALGGEIGTRVLEVGCMDAAGLPLTIPVGEVGFSYRHAAGLADKVVTDVMLDVRPAGAAATIQAEREAVRARRAWWQGLRCAGSVFRNPPGESAGRLIEQCGLKGLQVGGARIYDGHANVIVTVDGALASDVRSLIETVQVEVFDPIGIPLEPEVIFLE
jgi:UDP-N-acetylenolpyruvoylglucosamine reductase